jgi:hypothetical protein
MVAQWADMAGQRLRRHRARIGPWVLELVGENQRTHQLLAQHWASASVNQPTDAYCYLVPHRAHEVRAGKKRQPRGQSAIQRCVVCPANGRALACDALPYADVNRVCDAIMMAWAAARVRVAKSASRRLSGDNFWLLPATCVEYQSEAGDTRSLALLGSELERSVHAYSLALCKPENGLVSDSVTGAERGSLSVFRIKSRLWWPTSLVHAFRSLLPHLVMSPFEGLSLDPEVMDSLREYRNGVDLARAIDGGSFPEEQCERLAELLELSKGGHSLIDPRDLLGTDRCLEQSHLTDLVRSRSDLGSNWILREVPRSEFLTTASSDLDVFGGDLAAAMSQAYTDGLTQWLDTGRVRCTMLNIRLPTVQTQFCIRHFLEGLSDSIQLLSPESFRDGSILESMRVEARSAAEWAGGPAVSFRHGLRRIQLVGFSRAGRLTECVAFDPVAEGYAQVRSVWPGQVADFFTRHVGLRVRDLFTESGFSVCP